ncbi:MAG: hypothetical protein Q9M94_07510 [Candidatus Gracilibacteria bacterium]|nr:hypothetical protein [Candidatus Gracilibacteria bacterium]
MISYLLKIWVLLIFSAIIIFNYYGNKDHIENFDGYMVYSIWIFIFYGMYKFFQLNSLNNRVLFTPIKIFGYFFVHLILLSSLFFYYNGSGGGESFGNGIALSFKIFFYSLLPLTITIISIAFGQFFLKNILYNYKERSSNYKLITGIGVGIFLFIFSLTVVGMIGFYNIYSVLGILIIFSIIGYKELINLISGIFNYEIKCTNHNIYSESILKQINPKLLSTEFFFIIITLLLSVNLISIFRPFPIGWDDLGAYMNFAHLMANDGTIGFLGSMMSWQTFTGIGYMFNNPTLAFFLNNVGGFVSVIVISLIISEIFKNTKKTFINLPLLASMLFISMPMIVFQQAKDMKLDAGLFFISIIALYMLFEFYNGYTSPPAPLLKAGEGNNKNLLPKKEIIKLFGVIGLLLGFAFTIKFTGLLLISAVLGILFFTRLGILGFLGYLSIYFAIFTAGGLWSKMNVVTGFDDETRINFSLISLIVGIAFLVTARVRTKKRFRRFIPRIGALFIGILIAISPWAINNINQAGKVGVSEILSGKSERFIVDYSKIHSEEKLEILNNKTELSRGISSSGTTSNEDFGRYFGYEKGINNYIKLPWNLTMQKNQGGEFTDIGFIFLALLPALLLFLPFRKNYYSLGVYALLFLEILLFIIPSTNNIITAFLASFTLPFGYIIILLLFLLPLVFLIPTLQKKNLENLFKINLIFTIFYTFLWSISAFGIVWYGIVMYFNFILLIIFGAYYLGSYNSEDIKEEKQIRFFGTLVFFTIISIYILMSIFPHSFSNLKKAGYKEYKQGEITIAEAPFLYHKEYLNILFHLNISEDKRKDFILDNIKSEELKDIINNNIKNISINGKINISKTEEFLKYIIQSKEIPDNIKISSKNSLQNIYSGILEPYKYYKSNEIIYRIGTFLKYNISENNKRLYEDSLVTQFNKYFYNKSPDITINRMKDLGLKYLLVDLNAATIDQDPRHNLTKRYENLLKTFTSDKIELIETDSICLKMGIENYKKQKDINVFIALAGVNYDSYNEKGERYGRNDKKIECYKKVIDLFNLNKIDGNNYNYLLHLKPYLDKLDTENEKINLLYKNFNYSGKVLFKIK